MLLDWFLPCRKAHICIGNGVCLLLTVWWLLDNKVVVTSYQAKANYGQCVTVTVNIIYKCDGGYGSRIMLTQLSARVCPVWRFQYCTLDQSYKPCCNTVLSSYRYDKQCYIIGVVRRICGPWIKVKGHRRQTNPSILSSFEVSDSCHTTIHTMQ